MVASETLCEPAVRALELTPGEINFYKREGYLCLPGLLPPPLAEALRLEVLGIMKQIGLGVSKLRQTHEYLAGSLLDGFVNNPALRDTVCGLLEGPSSLYMPFTAVKSPGGGVFNFHQDNQYTRLDGPALNLWFALGPMAPENGCLQIVPRSHLNGTLESEEVGDGHRKTRFEPAEFLPMRMNAGDCVAFSRLTVHGSGANATSEPRVGYALQFHRDDVRWLDRSCGQWKVLRQFPRWDVKPVRQISVPKEKIDGH